ncbi:forkhead box protein N4-like [Hypomesus transpacificus]|uniref:forkhead box protein N4-like n=1 Tax=Hypomesus transpacificus TaxID=137520 RepID=UPI001F07357F|nr:forkhead box protein N4-like [Hypomesus transpacificus]
MVIEIPQCEDLHPYPVSPVSITTTLQQNDSSQQCEGLAGDLPSLSWLTTVDVPSLQQRACSKLTSSTEPQDCMQESDTSSSMRTAQGSIMCPYSNTQSTYMDVNSQNGEMTEYPGFQYTSDFYDFSPQLTSPSPVCSGGPDLCEQQHGRSLYSNQDQQHTRPFPKPMYSYSCLIAMALNNSQTGSLPVSEIYGFMREHFPYFKTAPDGWKNSVRHNLSLNKCFQKVEVKQGSSGKGCLWSLNPAKVNKMEEEIQKWKRKDPVAIRRSMANPDELEKLMSDRPEGSQGRACWDPRMNCVPCRPPLSGRLPGAPFHLQALAGSPLPAQTPPLHPGLDFSHSPLAAHNPYQSPHALLNHQPDYMVEVDTSFVDFAGCLWEEMREEGYDLDTVGLFSGSPLCVSERELSVPLGQQEDRHMEDLYTTLAMATAVPSPYITTQDAGQSMVLL